MQKPEDSDPRLAEAPPSTLGRVFGRVLRYKGLLEKVGALSIILAAAQYFFTYGERVEERQNKDVEVIRQVQILHLNGGKESTKGFLGISGPLERLTRDCGKRSWWRLPMWYFERDCVPLPSLKLEYADLGDVRLQHANLSQGSFHCSNLRGAHFNNADLAFKWLGGANLAYADFRGARFRDTSRDHQKNQFWFADLTGAIFDEDSDLAPEALLCGCVSDDRSIDIRDGSGGASKFAKVKEDLKKQRCLRNVCGTLFLEAASDEEKAKRHGLPASCAGQ